MRNQVCILLVVASLVCTSYAALDAVKDVQVESYLGRWYQTHSNVFSDFFADISESECVTATYGAINATFVSVYNNYKTRDGLFDEIYGYGFIPDITQPGKLLVALDGVPIDAPYWIFKLGPIVDGQYEYSIVSDDLGLGLFVLARDVPRFEALYENEVVEYLTLTGFTGPREPIKEYHGSDCEYAPFPLPSSRK